MTDDDNSNNNNKINDQVYRRRWCNLIHVQFFVAAKTKVIKDEPPASVKEARCFILYRLPH